jgi:methylated-DNA-[protein]-cysteine S-methyltransferase
MIYSAQTIQTPLGSMTLVENGTAITELRFGERLLADERPQSTPLLRMAAQELMEYFGGTRKAFTVPLSPEGTTFQQSVWKALEQIPYGTTASYGEIAKRIGKPKASRAVGMANNKNPLPVFIPCHRVIGADGKLVGYGAGLDKKEFLLALEATPDR